MNSYRTSKMTKIIFVVVGIVAVVANGAHIKSKFKDSNKLANNVWKGDISAKDDK